jgi:hypothetical protein
MVNVSEVRRTWTERYGVAKARQMLAGADAAAYDAARGLAYGSRRLARDQEPDDSGSTRGAQTTQEPDNRLEQVRTFLKNRLSPEDWDRLQAMTQGQSGGGEGEPEPDDTGSMHRATGRDEPPDFPGRPRTAGGQSDLLPERDRGGASDARGGSYFANFKGNAGVGFSY